MGSVPLEVGGGRAAGHGRRRRAPGPGRTRVGAEGAAAHGRRRRAPGPERTWEGRRRARGRSTTTLNTTGRETIRLNT
jgi:hypothetical protein